MTGLLERILPTVQKPARYTGGEYGQIVKDKRDVDVRVAFCFPDTYEIGMSNIGMRILYGIMNNMPRVCCERSFMPWGDMVEKMRAHNLPLWALESRDPLTEFDLVAFSVGYEMSYTNILQMLMLAGIPLYASEREGLHGLVFAGGTCAYNPEPLAPFVDFFSIGEGEELTVEILTLYEQAKREGWSKQEFLKKAAQLEGVYVPSLYEITYGEDGTISSVTPKDGAPRVVTKRIVQDMDRAYYPTDGITPSTEIVHDRSVLEVFRGCIRGCRFCQAGFVYRPVRPKSPEVLTQQAAGMLESSGCTELTLSSLSTSDYKRLPELADALIDYCEPRNINLSLPSLRADNFSASLMQRVQKVHKSSLTFAPEAGTQRLRDVINKNVTEEEILRTCAGAFAGGWSSVKLYFMLGLPTETDKDVLGIAELCYKILGCWREHTDNPKRRPTIHISTAFFVPKPDTPFQWEPQITQEEYIRRQKLLKEHLRNRAFDYKWHASDVSMLEAVLARGDRRLAPVLETAAKKGAMLDGWNDYFSMEIWENAFAACGVDPAYYARRSWGKDEILPWDVISCGVSKDFLWREREAAYRGVVSPDCRKQCTGCGANQLYKRGICDE